MKLTKNDLKGIVKECLTELLQEGIGNIFLVAGSDQPRQAVTSQIPVRNSFAESTRAATASKISYAKTAPNPALRDIVKRESGGNKVMESILADTASTTLQSMLQNEVKGAIPAQPINGGAAERIVANTDLNDIFGSDTASKWADLAFASSPRK